MTLEESKSAVDKWYHDHLEIRLKHEQMHRADSIKKGVIFDEKTALSNLYR